MAEMTEKQAFPQRELVLNKSKIKVSVPDDWTLADSNAAQRAARKDTAKFPLYLAQRVCLFDGKRQTMGWIEENIHGKDGLQLIGALFGDDDDEDSEGNA